MQRTRTSILVKDNGDLTFNPSTAWTNEDEIALEKDCKIDDVSNAPLKRVSLNPMQTFSNQTRGIPNTAATSHLPTPPTAGSTASAATAKSVTSVSTLGSNKITKKTTAPDKTSNKATSAKSKNIKFDATSATAKVLPAIPESTLELHKTVHDLFASSAEPDAIILVNLLKSTCTIKDYELNSFQMDLAFGRVKHDDEIVVDQSQEASEEEKVVDVFNKKRESPMDVTVLLAGEVPGLKPPAVARYPKPPKLFIINRHGEATEVISVQDVSVIEHKIKVCPDAYRFDEKSEISPSELGPMKQLRYFTQK